MIEAEETNVRMLNRRLGMVYTERREQSNAATYFLLAKRFLEMANAEREKEIGGSKEEQQLRFKGKVLCEDVLRTV